MAFEYVNWQPDDEVVGAKLKQMSDNEQWLADNIVSGSLNIRTGPNGELPFGRTPGTYIAKTVYGVYIPFNSNVSVLSYDISIPYPPIFTSPPNCVVQHADGTGTKTSGTLVGEASLTAATYKVYRVDGTAGVLRGAIHAIILGY